MRIWQILFRRRGYVKPPASAVKHPAIGDFYTVVTKAGVNVTFKPTNSIYIFYRLADNNVIARLGSHRSGRSTFGLKSRIGGQSKKLAQINLLMIRSEACSK